MQNQIKWSEYETSSGNVKTIDGILYSFFHEEDPENSELLASRLEELAVSSGWTYEIAPFLVDALVGHLGECCNDQGKIHKIYTILWEIVSGYPAAEIFVLYSGQRISLFGASLMSVSMALRFAVTDLSNSNEHVRVSAAEIITACARRGAAIPTSMSRTIYLNIFQPEKYELVSEARQELLLTLEGFDEDDVKRFQYKGIGSISILRPKGPSKMNKLIIALGLFQSEKEIEEFCGYATLLDV